MPSQRLSPSEMRDHLALESGEVCGIVRQLRRVVLKTVPEATEAVKFGALSYFHGDATFGSIGGNICMIDAKRGRVTLSFIRGVELEDPHGLLTGAGKYKRAIVIPNREAADDPRLMDLVREAAELDTGE